jgi:hypothetical protein
MILAHHFPHPTTRWPRTDQRRRRMQLTTDPDKAGWRCARAAPPQDALEGPWKDRGLRGCSMCVVGVHSKPGQSGRPRYQSLTESRSAASPASAVILAVAR